MDDNNASNSADGVQPVSAAPVTETATTGPVPAEIHTPNTAPKKNRRRVLLPIVAGAVLLFGGGAAAYNQVVLNSPEKIWEKSLQTTVDGFKEFVAASEGQDEKKGYALEGSFRVSEPVVIDGSIEGNVYELDSAFSSNIGASGVRVTSELVTKGIDGATYPDVYFKADGLDTIAGLVGLGGQDQQISDLINDYNDQWFVIDHTLLEEFQNQLDNEIDVDSQAEMLSTESVKELVDASLPVLEEYLFSVDESKSVFIVDESFGREEFEGADTYKYSVAVNKDNLKSFVQAYTETIKDTSYVKAVLEQSGQSIEEALDLDMLYEELDSSDFSDVKADVWVDMKRKFVRNVRFNVETGNQEPNYIDVGLPYDGGDELPFTIKIVANEDGSKAMLELVAGYNNTTQDISLSFDVDVDDNGQKIVATGSLKTTSGNDPIDVDVPSDATNVLDLLGATDLNQLLNPYGSTGFDDPSLYDDSFYDDYYLQQQPSNEYLDAINEIQL